MCILFYVFQLSIINSLVIWHKVIRSKVTNLGFRQLLVEFEGLVGQALHASAKREAPHAKCRRVSASSLPLQRLVNNSHTIHGLEAKAKNCVWC